MRILVISYSYFPVNSPRAFRWSAICEYWAQCGIIVDVVCAHAQVDLPKSERVNGVNIHCVRDPSQRFRPVEASQPCRTVGDERFSGTRMKTMIQGVLKQSAILFRWPDYAWLWIMPAYRQAGRLLRSHLYDGIISVALPFSSHIVAMLLRRQRKHIPWICDYGDPFSYLKTTPLNNDWLYHGLSRYIEKKVIYASQRISVTTAETAAEYVAYLGVCEDWFRVIPPLIKGNSGLPAVRKKDIGSGKGTIHLIFAGVLYAKIRSPVFLLELLSEVRRKIMPLRLVIHFYGSIGDCIQEFEPYKSAIGDWIFLHGTVDKTELMSIYETADVLVNIGNTTTYQVPSKVIEYMSTGLPILNIVFTQGDLSASLLQSYPASLSIFQESATLKKAIDEVYDFIKKAQRVDAQTVNEILKEYRHKAISDSYLRMLS